MATSRLQAERSVIWLNSSDGIARLKDCIVQQDFQSAANIQANTKLELDKIKDGSEFFGHVVAAWAGWLIAAKIQVATAVPTGANRFMRAAARLVEVPFVTFAGKAGDFRPMLSERGGREQIVDAERIGVGEDVRSTGHSTIEFARFLGFERVQATVIADRGQDQPGIVTAEEVRQFSRQNPDQPPAHISLTGLFPMVSLIQYPLPLYRAESAN